MSTKPLMPLAGRIKFTEGEPYEDGSLGKKLKDIDESVANEISDRQYADAVIQNQLNEETLRLVPTYISNANTFFTAGAGKTNTATTGLPPEVSAYEHDKWGTIFYLPENEEENTGTQIYHCIAYNGSPNRGKIYKRLVISGVPTAWEVVGGGGSKTTIVETIDDAPANPQIGDRITVLQDGSTDSVPMSAVIGLINALNGKQNLLPSGANNGDILVWDASQNKYVSKPKWQMIYQPVEYIESTGSQRIDTDVIGNENTSMEIDFLLANYVSGRWADIMGAAQTNVTRALHIGCYSNSKITYQRGTGIYVDVDVLFDLSERHTIKANDIGIYCDNTLIGQLPGPVEEFSTPRGLSICATKYSDGGYNYSSIRVYKIKIYESEELVRYFIPVRSLLSDNSIGLYDLVEGKFYGNAGTGTFLKGADI